MNLEYNTQVDSIRIKEYGRNVQRMIAHAKTIKDRDERNLAVKDIIKVMELINPDPKKGADHEHKLWDHLHMISDNELDIDSPYELPSEEIKHDKIATKPAYPKGRIRYKHYGRTVENMIAVCAKEEDPETRKRMEQYLGGYMKLAYKQWNEQKMSDDVIIHNIKDMSKGEIVLTEIVDITKCITTTADNQLLPKAPSRKSTSNLPKRKRKKRR